MKEDNPLYKFKYCPICGSNQFEIHAENARKCQACGFTYYTNPRGATVAIILNEKDELLVARRANEPAKGTLDLVGGFMDLGETVEEAMIREIYEETGIQVKEEQLKYILSEPNRYPFSGIVVHTADCFFECRLDQDISFEAHDDVESLRWIPLKDIKIEDFGLVSVRAGLSRYLNKKHH